MVCKQRPSGVGSLAVPLAYARASSLMHVLLPLDSAAERMVLHAVTIDWQRGFAGYGGCVQHGQQRGRGRCRASPEGAGAPDMDACRGGNCRRHGSRQRCLCKRPRLPGAGKLLPRQADSYGLHSLPPIIWH